MEIYVFKEENSQIYYFLVILVYSFPVSLFTLNTCSSFYVSIIIHYEHIYIVFSFSTICTHFFCVVLIRYCIIFILFYNIHNPVIMTWLCNLAMFPSGLYFHTYIIYITKVIVIHFHVTHRLH